MDENVKPQWTDHLTPSQIVEVKEEIKADAEVDVKKKR